MADVESNSQSSGTVRIAVDPGKPNDESTNNGVPEAKNERDSESKIESVSSVSGKSDIEKNSVGEPGRDAVSRLLLRPSALSRDGFKSSPIVSTPSLLTKQNSSSNKFACPDESVDSLFNVPSKSEKTETLPSLNAHAKPVTVPLSNPNYVFGQNIGDRVAEKVESSSNGTGAMLFSSVLSAETNKESGDESKESSSLLEDAARCQEQRAAKRKYEEVQVTTGEEDEMNVLQVTVKLFAFEGGSWVERGRGNLRLNDFDGSASRIVVRTMGNLRVALNTKIWSGMELSRVSERSIRITAMDPTGTLKIFLLQASPSDITMLFNSMETRIHRCQAAEQTESKNEVKSDEKEDRPRSPKVAALETS